HLIDALIDTVNQNEICDSQNRRHLTNAVDPPNTLLDSCGVPGQIVVDERTCRLEVESLTRCIRTQENSDFTFGKASRDGLLGNSMPRIFSPDRTASARVAGNAATISREQLLAQIFDCIRELGEDETGTAVVSGGRKRIDELIELAVACAERLKGSQQSVDFK